MRNSIKVLIALLQCLIKPQTWVIKLQPNGALLSRNVTVKVASLAGNATETDLWRYRFPWKRHVDKVALLSYQIFGRRNSFFFFSDLFAEFSSCWTIEFYQLKVSSHVDYDEIISPQWNAFRFNCWQVNLTFGSRRLLYNMIKEEK